MLRYIAIVFFGLMLAGCVSPEEQRAMDQDKCSSFGFTLGTDAFANCMMQQSAQREELAQRQMEAEKRAELNKKAKGERRRSRDNYEECPGCAPAPGAGMANPASQYCVEQGGRLEIRKEFGGDVGYCHTSDGRVIEEWTLFRSQ